MRGTSTAVLTTKKKIKQSKFADNCKRMSGSLYSGLSKQALIEPDKTMLNGVEEFANFIINSTKNLEVGVRFSILKEETPVKRAKKIEYYVAVMQEAVKNKDFFTAQTILGALGNVQVRQLYLTWKNVNANDKTFLRDIAYFMSSGKGLLEREAEKEKNSFEVIPILSSIKTMNMEYKNAMFQNTQNIFVRFGLDVTKGDQLPPQMLLIKELLHRGSLFKLIKKVEGSFSNPDEIRRVVQVEVESQFKRYLEENGRLNNDVVVLDYENDIKGKVVRVVDAALSLDKLINYSLNLQTSIARELSERPEDISMQYLEAADEGVIEELFRSHKAAEKIELERRSLPVAPEPEVNSKFEDILRLKNISPEQKVEFLQAALNQREKTQAASFADNAEKARISGNKLSGELDAGQQKTAGEIERLRFLLKSPELQRTRTSKILARSSAAADEEREGRSKPIGILRGRRKPADSDEKPASSSRSSSDSLSSRKGSRASDVSSTPGGSMVESRSGSFASSPMLEATRLSQQRSEFLIKILSDRNTGAILKVQEVRDVICPDGYEAQKKALILDDLATLAQQDNASRSFQYLTADDRVKYKSCERSTLAHAILIGDPALEEVADIEAKKIIDEKYPGLVERSPRAPLKKIAEPKKWVRAERVPAPAPVQVVSEVPVVLSPEEVLQNVRNEVARRIDHARTLNDPELKLIELREIKHYIKTSDIHESESKVLIKRVMLALMALPKASTPQVKRVAVPANNSAPVASTERFFKPLPQPTESKAATSMKSSSKSGDIAQDNNSQVKDSPKPKRFSRDGSD